MFKECLRGSGVEWSGGIYFTGMFEVQYSGAEEFVFKECLRWNSGVEEWVIQGMFEMVWSDGICLRNV